MSESLSMGNLYNHFFLLHDFFHRLSRTKAASADFFDLQIEVNNSMKAAVRTGEKVSQGVAFTSLFYYFVRGRSVGLRFIYGFLFMYWYNHVITMGSYLGAYCRLPSVYKKAALYYQNHPKERNLIAQLHSRMEGRDTYAHPQVVVTEVFGQEDEEKAFVENDFFVQNREKYLPKEVLEFDLQDEKKLKYADHFLTRYVYYTFTRWLYRVGKLFSLEGTDAPSED